MALRKDHQDFLRAEIQTQIDQSIEAFNPHGWGRVTRWAREWGIAGTIIMAFLALCGITFGAVYQSFAHVRDETEFRTKTADRLTEIEARLTRVENSLQLLPAQLTISKFASVSPKELRSHPDELVAIEKNLTKVSRDVPNFWPTSFQVITLLSQSTSYLARFEQEKSTVADVQGIVIQKIGHLLLAGLIRDSTIKYSVVEFDPSVRLVNVTFIDCVFVFPPSQNPPPSLQKVGSELLIASDLSKITIGAA
jgi:hypothetical protein